MHKTNSKERCSAPKRQKSKPGCRKHSWLSWLCAASHNFTKRQHLLWDSTQGQETFVYNPFGLIKTCLLRRNLSMTTQDTPITFLCVSPKVYAYWLWHSSRGFEIKWCFLRQTSRWAFAEDMDRTVFLTFPLTILEAWEDLWSFEANQRYPQAKPPRHELCRCAPARLHKMMCAINALCF